MIFGMVHTPLPQPDFHNIRHHDSDGQICEYHDHLLRWHPQAGMAEDVAILHWHWFVPSAADPAADDPGSGLAIHAHISDWFTSSWDEAPRIVADDSSRLIGRLALTAPILFAPMLSLQDTLVPNVSDPGRSAATCAEIARTPSLNSLLQRWVC